MYFVSEYDANGAGLPTNASDLEKAVARAEASSLDDIAWGLCIPIFCACSCRCSSTLIAAGRLRPLSRANCPTADIIFRARLAIGGRAFLEGWRPAVVIQRNGCRKRPTVSSWHPPTLRPRAVAPACEMRSFLNLRARTSLWSLPRGFRPHFLTCHRPHGRIFLERKFTPSTAGTPTITGWPLF